VGGFLGVLLGGLAYEYTHSYNSVWWLSVLFGVLSAVINPPIVEKPGARAGAAPAGYRGRLPPGGPVGRPAGHFRRPCALQPRGRPAARDRGRAGAGRRAFRADRGRRRLDRPHARLSGDAVRPAHPRDRGRAQPRAEWRP